MSNAESADTELSETNAPTTATTLESNSDPQLSEKDPNGMVEDEEDEITGSVSLPLARVKKIFKMDPEYFASSETAVFSTAVATELFIQYFAEQASLMARSEKRKKIQYKDFSNAVASNEQLFFLSDTIPKTVPLNDLIKEKKITSKGIPNENHRDSDNTNGDDKNLLSKGQQQLKFGGSGFEKSTKEIMKTIIIDGDNDSEFTDVREQTADTEDVEMTDE